MEQLLEKVFSTIGEMWDPQREKFYIEGGGLHYFRPAADLTTMIVRGNYVRNQVGANARGVTIRNTVRRNGEHVGKEQTRLEHVSGDSFIVEVGDDNRNIAIGKDIHQTYVSVADADAARAIFASFKERIEAEAPQEKKAQAIERIDELEEAATSGNPDESTVRYVVGWFGKHIPQLASGLATMLTDPNVHRLIGSIVSGTPQ